MCQGTHGLVQEPLRKELASLEEGQAALEPFLQISMVPVEEQKR